MDISRGAAALALVWLLAACSPQPPASEPVRAVRTMTVGTDLSAGMHEYAAEVRARVESQLAFRVGGKMVERPAELGQHVRAGAVLARLDPQDLKLAQAAASAATQAAQVNAELADADLKRYRELHAQGFISAVELDRRESAARAARATLDQARAQAGVQANQTAYGTLTSAVDGVITAVAAEPGAVLAAGTPVLRLAHDGPRDVVFSVPEDAVEPMRRLQGRPGALRVRLWGDGRVMPVGVREVAASADAATRTYQVKADLGKAEARLGQTASVLVDLPPQAQVAKLPLTAVAQLDGKTAVWLVDKSTMTVRPQPITIAGAEGNVVLVSSGLAAGQLVVTAGVHVLTPGQKVKLYESPLAASAR